MGSRVARIAFVVTLAAGFHLTGCKPDYPACNNDDDCKEKGEVCVNKMCQECRDALQCEQKYPGEARECVNGRCDPKLECTMDGDCISVGEGLVCRSNKCVPECTMDADCPEGNHCEANRCVSGAECEDDIACGPGRVCDNGVCIDAPQEATNISAGCRPMDGGAGDIIALSKVLFDFDRYELTVDARSALEQSVECLRQAPNVSVIVEGHCDERGTQEYNLALGEKRANTVVSYLRNMGIETSRMKTRSKGENEPDCMDPSESCWAQNRRVQFIQRIQ